MRAIKVRKNAEVEKIEPKKIIKLTDMGNVKEVMYLKHRNIHGFGMKKISKEVQII